MNTNFSTSTAKTLLVSPQLLRGLAIWTLSLLLVAILALLFVPWQQTVTGVGKVTVFSPMHRPQNIEAQISGRIHHWNVVEGQHVNAGEVIAELVDIDPKFLDSRQLQTLELQKQALIERKTAAQARITALQIQKQGLTQSRQAAIPGAGAKVSQSKERIVSSQQSVEAAQQNYKTATYQYTRIKELYEKGLRSKREFELAELEKVKAETSVQQGLAQLRIAQRDMQVSRFDQEKIKGDTAAALANIAVSLACAQETIASISSDMAKLEVDISNLKHRMEQRKIRSPIKGQVVRLMKIGAGETVSSGSVLAVVVPFTRDQAAELYLSDWDIPLVSEGRHVRLQFSGWPALQFSGWPMIATGTFGGKVTVIDAVDDGKGRYRILVKPDLDLIKQGKDDPWPSSKYLRPGTEVIGWIMLDTVPLGYELWRQFNGFPPRLKDKSHVEKAFAPQEQEKTNQKKEEK